MALLDYKVSIGYDFDGTHAEEDERRIADTFRVISLSFSNLGGPEAVREYYGTSGSRSYEDRVYSNLGEHYLAQLRYDDAAKTYKAFVALYPVPPGRAALQHAGRGDLHAGRVPQAGAGIEAGVRVQVRTAGRVLASASSPKTRRRC